VLKNNPVPLILNLPGSLLQLVSHIELLHATLHLRPRQLRRVLPSLLRRHLEKLHVRLALQGQDSLLLQPRLNVHLPLHCSLVHVLLRREGLQGLPLLLLLQRNGHRVLHLLDMLDPACKALLLDQLPACHHILP